MTVRISCSMSPGFCCCGLTLGTVPCYDVLLGVGRLLSNVRGVRASWSARTSSQ